MTLPGTSPPTQPAVLIISTQQTEGGGDEQDRSITIWIAALNAEFEQLANSSKVFLPVARNVAVFLSFKLQGRKLYQHFQLFLHVKSKVTLYVKSFAGNLDAQFLFQMVFELQEVFAKCES
eukprot:scaffold4788_cov19-Tisochrysis_lutea.AAC.1